jgi:hypothetical protein
MDVDAIPPDVQYFECPNGVLPDSFAKVAQYEPFSRIDQKRILARKNGSSYVYDFPRIFEAAAREVWRELRPAVRPLPRPLVTAEEYVLNAKTGSLAKATAAEAGQNRIGMVVWLLRLKMPDGYSVESGKEEFRAREVVVISNDITFQSGSFSTEEDELFRLASEQLSRMRGLHDARCCLRVPFAVSLSAIFLLFGRCTVFPLCLQQEFLVCSLLPTRAPELDSQRK